MSIGSINRDDVVAFCTNKKVVVTSLVVITSAIALSILWASRNALKALQGVKQLPATSGDKNLLRLYQQTLGISGDSSLATQALDLEKLKNILSQNHQNYLLFPTDHGIWKALQEHPDIFHIWEEIAELHAKLPSDLKTSKQIFEWLQQQPAPTFLDRFVGVPADRVLSYELLASTLHRLSPDQANHIKQFCHFWNEMGNWTDPVKKTLHYQEQIKLEHFLDQVYHHLVAIPEGWDDRIRRVDTWVELLQQISTEKGPLSYQLAALQRLHGYEIQELAKMLAQGGVRAQPNPRIDLLYHALNTLVGQFTQKQKKAWEFLQWCMIWERT